MYTLSFVSFTWRWLNKSTKSWYNRVLTSTVSDAPIDTRNDNRISFKSEKWISNREKKIIHKHSKLSIVNTNNTNNSNSNNIANNNSMWLILYIYWLCSRTTGVLPEKESIAWSRRLSENYPFEGLTKLLLSEKPVYICFVMHLHFFKLSYYI